MNNLLKCKLVMLPANQKADYIPKRGDIILKASNKKLAIMSENDIVDYLDSDSTANKHQHLYIISDREIKEGDWLCCMDEVPNNGNFDNDNISPQFAIRKRNKVDNCQNDKRIEATTDFNLYLKNKDNPFPFNEKGESNYFIPKISEAFIKAYIEARNNNKNISEINIEMEAIPHEFDNPLSNPEGVENKDSIYEVKTREDNTVIILAVKETFTREEVMELVESAHCAGTTLMFNKNSLSRDERLAHLKMWINKNIC